MAKNKNNTPVIKIFGIAALFVVGVAALASIVTFNQSGETTDSRTFAKGNGAPVGAHYNLNIHGVPKNKTADMTGSKGHNIFVPEFGKCRINLSEGSYEVLDGNCTDGPAAFQLPNPDPDNTGFTTYSVWARALGKPGGKADASTCADLLTVDETTGLETTETYCSVYTLNLERKKGKSTFGDVSRELLYIYADLDANGVVERYPLFDEALQDYFWGYDNKGLKLVQLRFYPVSSEVPAL